MVSFGPWFSSLSLSRSFWEKSARRLAEQLVQHARAQGLLPEVTWFGSCPWPFTFCELYKYRCAHHLKDLQLFNIVHILFVLLSCLSKRILGRSFFASFFSGRTRSHVSTTASPNPFGVLARFHARRQHLRPAAAGHLLPQNNTDRCSPGSKPTPRNGHDRHDLERWS